MYYFSLWYKRGYLKDRTRSAGITVENGTGEMTP